MVLEGTMEYDNESFQLEYHDTDDFSELEISQCKQVYAVYFISEEQILLVYNGKKRHWGLPGGTIELGESLEASLNREILEESNTQVVAMKPVGYQKVTDSAGRYFYQLRCVCIVRPLGTFSADPAGDIHELLIIKPQEYRRYFDWGEIGEYIMLRATELYSTLILN